MKAGKVVDQEIEVHQATMKLGLVLLAAVWVPLVAGKYWNEYDAKILNQFDDRTFTDCDDARKRGGYESDGLYYVAVNGTSLIPVECRMGLNATFTAILVQKLGEVNFRQPYVQYVRGFRSASANDYWMGLDAIKSYTDRGYNVLTVTLQDWNHYIRTIQYRYFKLGEAYDGYRLAIGSYQSGHVLPDDFSFNNGMPFFTIDRPDAHGCARQMGAGWWYNYCTYTLPTGKYYLNGHYKPSGGMYDGIFYNDWEGYGYSLKYIRLEVSMV